MDTSILTGTETLWTVAPARDAGAPTRTEDAKIMIVDDEEFNVHVFRRHLKEAGYSRFVTTCDSSAALKLLDAEHPDLLLLDVMMPQPTGLDLLSTIRGDAHWRRLPIIVLTASTDSSIKLRSLEMGATDFLAKPVHESELVLRIRNTLLAKRQQDYLADYSAELEREVRTRTAELEASRRELIHCLGRAAEFRDEQTGHHVARVGQYVAIVADELGFDARYVEMLKYAAQLHDVGKIGIPDAILLKPGRLTPEEFDIMKHHAEYGVRIIQPSAGGEGGAAGRMGPAPAGGHSMLSLAAVIAASHHEKWDGSGYPRGLRGEEIPIEGRMTAVADVFDALTSSRPYKPAFPLEKSLAIMEEGRGKHFDPAVLDAFLRRRIDVLDVMVTLADFD